MKETHVQARIIIPHPNIVQFKRVFYGEVTNSVGLKHNTIIIAMEMCDTSLEKELSTR
jgi:hypothetical protein